MAVYQINKWLQVRLVNGSRFLESGNRVLSLNSPRGIESFAGQVTWIDNPDQVNEPRFNFPNRQDTWQAVRDDVLDVKYWAYCEVTS